MFFFYMFYNFRFTFNTFIANITCKYSFTINKFYLKVNLYINKITLCTFFSNFTFSSSFFLTLSLIIFCSFSFDMLSSFFFSLHSDLNSSASVSLPGLTSKAKPNCPSPILLVDVLLILLCLVLLVLR